MTSKETVVWAIVPVKGFRHAKSRLVPCLGRARTSKLARAMLMDVLEVLSQSTCFAGILVVTGDEDAVEIARRYGATVLIEPDEAGTNAAVGMGIAHAVEIGVQACVVVPSDIPFLRSAELIAIIEGLADAEVVIIPAQRDGGTNVLGLRPPDIIHTAFGQDSFVRHLALIDEAGAAVKVLRLSGAGHDIDMPVDLDDISCHGRHTHAIFDFSSTGTIRPSPDLPGKRPNL